MRGRNILITGGCGFIGSHIANNLIEDNNVTIVDNLSTGKLDFIDNIEHENLNFINADLNEVNLIDITKDIDYIFHLAAMASVPLSVEQPEFCNKQNVTATIKLLNAAVSNDVKKIVFSSSSAVYGENKNMPLSENELLMPSSPYAASKASCELYLKSFYESYGLDYVILRYFNVFGPKQDKNSQYSAVIPKFISALLENKQPIIYGDGEQTRDFVFVEDVAKANISASKSKVCGVFNVASGKSLSINELFEIVKNTLNSDLTPKYLPERLGDIKHSLADISNLKKIDVEINYKDFEQNLIKTIIWFKQELSSDNVK